MWWQRCFQMAYVTLIHIIKFFPILPIIQQLHFLRWTIPIPRNLFKWVQRMKTELPYYDECNSGDSTSILDFFMIIYYVFYDSIFLTFKLLLINFSIFDILAGIQQFRAWAKNKKGFASNKAKWDLALRVLQSQPNTSGNYQKTMQYRFIIMIGSIYTFYILYLGFVFFFLCCFLPFVHVCF